MHIVVESFSLSSSFEFVRGYMDPAKLDVTMTNMDPMFDVVPVPEGRSNFNVSVFYSDVDPRVSTPSLNIPGDADIFLTGTNFPRNATMVLEGKLSAYISRETCSDISYVCFEVSPGYRASYTKPSNVADAGLKCINVVDHRNCNGM